MRITVRGILAEGVFGPGGESTGWEIRLDNEIGVEGHTLTTIEVDRETVLAGS